MTQWISGLTMALALALTLATACFFWHCGRRRRAGALNEAQTAFKACDRLLELLGHLQQHRGMSSAWLSGEAAFLGRMQHKRQAIDVLFPALAAAALHESAAPRPCLTRNDLALFRFKWHALVDKLGELTVEQSIAQHSQLIACVLAWLADLGEARIELPASGRVPPGRVRNYAARLPALSECLGQARAIGSSVAARHGCAPVARVRLMFLIARAESLLSQALAAGDDGLAGDRAKSAVEEMARTIRLGMLASAGVAVSADAYFAVATRAIDAVFAWGRLCGGQLQADIAGPAGEWRGDAGTIATAAGR